jgi:hypothetical protein
MRVVVQVGLGKFTTILVASEIKEKTDHVIQFKKIKN